MDSLEFSSNPQQRHYLGKLSLSQREEAEKAEMLEALLRKRFIHSDLLQFLKNPTPYSIYIFPDQGNLYLLLFRNPEIIDKIGILHWNEVTQYGVLLPHEQQVVKTINDGELLESLQLLLKGSFHLYLIPFYFISHVLETFIPSKFGELPGDWKVAIHPNVEIIQNQLPFQIQPPTFTLRKYQKIAIDSWHRNRDFGTVALATAGGKTIIGLQAIYDVHSTTLIIVPTKALGEQWKRNLIKRLRIPASEIGIFHGSSKQIRPITIGTYASIMRHIYFSAKERNKLTEKYSGANLEARIKRREQHELLLQNYFVLLIPDESHHIPAPLFKRISLHSKALKRLSLSATVERFDHNESLLYFSAGKQVFALNYIELCREGWVAPFLYKHLEIKLSEDDIQYYRKMKGDREGKRRMTFYNFRKMDLAVSIAKEHTSKGHQIILFVNYIDDAKNMMENLRSVGIPSGIVLSEENQRKLGMVSCEAILNQFSKKELMVLIATTKLDEGIDLPDCSVGIIMSGSSSKRQMIQRIGRIVRISEKDKQKVAHIYELTTVSEEFITIDEKNHLLRNGMIEKLVLKQAMKKRERPKQLLAETYWIFNYSEIEAYCKNGTH